MDIQILSKDDRPLLKRTEVRARIAFTGATPSRKEVIAAVSKATNAKRELVVVNSIDTTYGDQSAVVHAFTYHDRKSLELLERSRVIEKHTFEEKKAEQADGEKPAAPAKEGGEE